MKKLILPLLFLSLFALFIFSSCTKDNSPVSSNQGSTSGVNTLVRTTPEGGILAYDGYSMTILPNTVPKTSTGGNGTVTFSIETKTELDSGVAGLPSGYTLVGKYVKFGPDGFTFKYPVKMSFPGGNESSPEKLVIMRYYPDRNQWFRVNTSTVDSVNKIISTDGDSLRLGYFALVKSTTSFSPAGDGQGGFEFTGESDKWYTLTVASCTLTYPYQGVWFSGGSPVGHTFSSGSSPTGNTPLSPTHAYLPQGTYSIWISRRTYSGDLYTYSVPYTGTIGSALQYWGWGNASNWAHLTDPGGGSWVLGSPANWPPPTAPMGTGKFQATLTWINGSGNDVDLDLHLILPSGEDVYYNHMIANDSSFALDRDWTHPLGNAIENIYSLKNTLPSGSYKVKIVYFGGAVTKQFNTRVLLNGNVSTYTGSLSSAGAYVIVYTFNL
jgi:hypothetical protein